MEASKSPPGSVRRHGRNVSYPMVRRSTKGPLDDPLAEPTSAPSPAAPSDTLPTETQRVHQESPQPTTQPRPNGPKVDVRFLQDPNIYHQIATEDTAPSFLNSPKQPPPNTPLSTLLQHGHFRRAAETALDQLRKCEPTDAENILRLLHTRLASLILISRPDIASQEAIPLLEMLSRNPPGAKEVLPLVPWELRLLLVRLQSLGADDGGRRGIMALYALASEVRAHIGEAQESGDEAERAIWSARVRDLGLRVADSFVEMGELETASRHLSTITDADGDEIAARKALLRVRVGDVGGARRAVERIRDEQRKAMLSALLTVADGDLSVAIDAWRNLAEQEPDQVHPLFGQNLAVCMLYTGHIGEARGVLEKIAEQSPAFPTLLFNLSTVYELCTERAIEYKTSLGHQMADKPGVPDSGGWERANYEFKL